MMYARIMGKPIGNNPHFWQGLWALSPLLVFVAFYLSLSLVSGDFYQVKITVAFLVATAYAFLVDRHRNLTLSLDSFCHSAGNTDVMLMVMIFILAGAFASTAKTMGCIDATVSLTLQLLPSQFVLSGLFLASCFVSLSIGTSVGTIAALTPIAAGVASQTDASLPLLVAVVVGGSFFGDNLSFISDTTIMATKTQGCQLADKFHTNLRLAVPAALIALIIYSIMGTDIHASSVIGSQNVLKVLPYLFVLVAAVCRMNVILVLILGTLMAGGMGLWWGEFTLMGWFAAMDTGIMGMAELITVTLLAAGLMGIIRQRGGIEMLMRAVTRCISSKRGAELSIAALVIMADLCTANNTIAILTVGPLARQLSETYGIDPRRSASLLDTCSCFAQGLIPYGAQLLIAAGLAAINPIDIIPYLYYPFLLGGITLLSIMYAKSWRV